MAKSSTRRVRPAARPVVRPAVVDADETRRAISWRHCALGLLAGEALLLIVSNVALGLTNAAFGSAGLNAADGGIVGITTLLAVILGGWLAARLAGRYELYQGVVVGIGFIVVGALFQFLQEAQITHTALASGSHYLVDLGPMSIGGVVTGDMLALFGGSVGGLFAARHSP